MSGRLSKLVYATSNLLNKISTKPPKGPPKGYKNLNNEHGTQNIQRPWIRVENPTTSSGISPFAEANQDTISATNNEEISPQISDLPNGGGRGPHTKLVKGTDDQLYLVPTNGPRIVPGHKRTADRHIDAYNNTMNILQNAGIPCVELVIDNFVPYNNRQAYQLKKPGDNDFTGDLLQIDPVYGLVSNKNGTNIITSNNERNTKIRLIDILSRLKEAKIDLHNPLIMLDSGGNPYILDAKVVSRDNLAKKIIAAPANRNNLVIALENLLKVI